jgi:hypothetical protein
VTTFATTSINRVEAVKEMISNSEYQNYNLLTMGLSPVFQNHFLQSFKKLLVKHQSIGNK